MRSIPLAAALVAALLLPAALPAGAADAPAWGDVSTSPIRPGSSLGGYCTLNFVFADAAGNAYIGTAGHCTDDAGERVSTPGAGRFGTVVYDSDTYPGADRDVDFSLIQIDAAKIGLTNPTLRTWTGPSGSAERADLHVGTPVAFHGYGMGFGANEATRPREGVITSTTPTMYQADMVAVWGDSGAPIIELATGKAVGIVSHFNLFGLPPTTDEGALMPFIFTELGRAGFDVALVTAAYDAPL